MSSPAAVLARLSRGVLPVLVAGVVLMPVAGCSILFSRDGCIAKADREVDELNKAMSGLVLEGVASGPGSRNDCDSGDDGGWLTYELKEGDSGEDIMKMLETRGWLRLAEQELSSCSDCLAGVARDWTHDRSIEAIVAQGQNGLRRLIVGFEDE
jgi:hypothetical protein